MLNKTPTNPTPLAPANESTQEPIDLCAIEDPTPKQILQSYAQDRDTILTEEEYQNVRASVILSLAEGPRLEPFIITIVSIIILGGLALAISGIAAWDNSIESGGLRVLIGLGIAFFPAMCLHSAITDYRADLRRPFSDRLTELDDLLQSNLITADEHASIKQALLTRIEVATKTKS